MAALFSPPHSSPVKIQSPGPSPSKSTAARKDPAQRQCRNVLIYGFCKFQDKGCLFSHPSALTVDAPVFVPKSAATTPQPTPVTATSEDVYDFYEEQPEQQPFFYQPPVYLRQPLDYHLYTPAPPSALQASTSSSHFVAPSHDLRQTLLARSETARGIAPIGLDIPEELQGYHTLVPLDIPVLPHERRKLGNWHTTVYRAIRASDGLPYALRRVENFRIMYQSAFTAIETWSNIQHPNIIPIVEAFTTTSFGDNSLIVVHSYHPNAQTLYDTYLRPKPPPAPPPLSPPTSSFRRIQISNSATQTQSQLIPERTLWSYIIQIASAIKRVHDAGHAVRMIDASKILVTGQNRVRISTCGVVDVLLHDVPQDINSLQQDDLVMLGRLVLALSLGNPLAMSAAGSGFQKSLEVMGRAYSPEVKGVALFLMGKGGPHRTIDQVLDMIRAKVITEMEDALSATDRLEYELLSELENARLVRLLCKFGFINERPEFAHDPRWSETGDRYILKLFRDYVFHQVDEHGQPVVNLAHVLTCLNKLDAGTDEKVLLVSRDEQSCLVVSYREIKACVESAFNDLTTGQK